MSILSKIYMNDREQAVSDILKVHQEHCSCIVHFLYFANVMHQRLLEGTPLESQQKYLESLETGDFCLADGIALQLFYKHGSLGKHIYMPHNLNGTDFNPYLFEQLSKDHTVSVYLYQCYDPPKGKDLVFVQKGIDALKVKFPRISVPWSSQCLFREKGKNFDRIWLEQAVQSDASAIKIFFNCTGTPFQEVRFMEHEQKLRELGFLMISAGGTIDYMTGFEERAPERVVKARVLETFWRICLHPGKNFKKFWWMFGVFRLWINRLVTIGLGKK
jgi:UDP-N-acetyl-D-mannosaminuronic acid transferase (WecB/TagA/CpsF family)